MIDSFRERDIPAIMYWVCVLTIWGVFALTVLTDPNPTYCYTYPDGKYGSHGEYKDEFRTYPSVRLPEC